ncbi:hypothetical protein [Clostridium sp. DJ247]|uniref:hypothetical protein n=1 Tax=Clostridium sp. DJ247 TaxID=2726188 RepID=UPI001628988C|nr:hypothetical protein [Clostridium sp. DJ247]MBC2582944.1 hypothetical protein [Clostridium sp. DJ247]
MEVTEAERKGKKIKITTGAILSEIYGKIVEIADNIGRKTAYEYDGDNLINVYFPNEGVLTYTYKDNLITAITDQDGNTYVKNEYDESGRVIKQYDREGSIIDVEYNDKDMENTFIHRSTQYLYMEKSILIKLQL